MELKFSRELEMMKPYVANYILKGTPMFSDKDSKSNRHILTKVIQGNVKPASKK